MGWIKDTKVSIIREEAERAADEGRRYFAPMLNTPWSQAASSTTSGAVGGWADMLEAIEDCGWKLEHWAIGQDAKGRPQAYPLFRRV